MTRLVHSNHEAFINRIFPFANRQVLAGRNDAFVFFYVYHPAAALRMKEPDPGPWKIKTSASDVTRHFPGINGEVRGLHHIPQHLPRTDIRFHWTEETQLDGLYKKNGR